MRLPVFLGRFPAGLLTEPDGLVLEDLAHPQGKCMEQSQFLGRVLLKEASQRLVERCKEARHLLCPSWQWPHQDFPAIGGVPLPLDKPSLSEAIQDAGHRCGGQPG